MTNVNSLQERNQALEVLADKYVEFYSAVKNMRRFDPVLTDAFRPDLLSYEDLGRAYCRKVVMERMELIRESGEYSRLEEEMYFHGDKIIELDPKLCEYFGFKYAGISEGFFIRGLDGSVLGWMRGE